ncbi:MAG: Wzz/FepE/Etk N-terminal domain-containing protein [Patescibacteria group bacterium]|nr:Wzz/FepE/Etk N-terminal domain-containing protein [Patescibacteria group bacterium]
MNIHEYTNVLKQKKQTVFSAVALFLVVAGILTIIQPFKYGSETKILVVQKNQYGVDPYQVNKANEYVGAVLADVITGNSFFNEIINSGFDVNRNYFPARLEDQSKEWKKTVKANSGSRGIITLSVFHKDKYQADQIIRAINAALKDKHALYHGLGGNIEIRIIDQPFTSELPVKPNVVLNLIFGALFGLLFALIYVYLFSEDKYNLRLWPRKKIKQRYDYNEEQDMELGNGVNRDKNYDVEEAIRKLRQRGKMQSFEPRQDENYQNKNQNNNDNSDYKNMAGQGSMKNVL